MRLNLDADQQLFRETTARFLDELVPVGEVRRLRDDPAGYDPQYWRRGAELGWTSLLVSEEAGGGSISGQGLLDLALVAHEFGAHAAPGPLLATNVVAASLARHDGAHPLVGRLLSGDAVASWAYGEPAPRDRLGTVTLEVRRDGADVVLTGVKRPVESAAQASHLLVTGRTGDGLTQVLVPTDTRGLTLTPMASVDLTRRFSVVRFDGVRVPGGAVLGEVGGAADDVDRQLHHALVIAAAEAVGAMQRAFDMTVEWAFDRYSFGRPLASYQALKHRFADMACWLEASHAVADAAATAVAGGQADGPKLASIALAYVGEHGSQLMQDCVQLHGGIGVTYEHDLHLFLRRHTVDRALYGTPADHRQRVTSIVERAAQAA
jgi:alkylation response protein AidB-like acyl-CoA dehydrogenase